ncbi:hypothetical protein D3C72_1952500 [compost metagenome]
MRTIGCTAVGTLSEPVILASRAPEKRARSPSIMRCIAGDRRSYETYWLHHMVSPPMGMVTADRIEIFGGTSV